MRNILVVHWEIGWDVCVKGVAEVRSMNWSGVLGNLFVLSNLIPSFNLNFKQGLLTSQLASGLYEIHMDQYNFNCRQMPRMLENID